MLLVVEVLVDDVEPLPLVEEPVVEELLPVDVELVLPVVDELLPVDVELVLPVFDVDAEPVPGDDVDGELDVSEVGEDDEEDGDAGVEEDCVDGDEGGEEVVCVDAGLLEDVGPPPVDVDVDVDGAVGVELDVLSVVVVVVLVLVLDGRFG